MAGYTALVTGGNRGIGLGLVEHLASDANIDIVFAAARQPEKAGALNALVEKFGQKIVPVKMDLNEASAAHAVKEVETILGGRGLDILINNAGMLNKYYGPLEKTPPQDFRDVFEVNVVGVQIVTQAFLPLLRSGKKKTIVDISSFLGSLEEADGRYKNFAFHAYSLTKTAVNFLVRDYAAELRDEGFTVIAINPGYVKTDMSPQGTLGVEEVATGIVKVTLDSKTESGEFYQWDGSKHAW